VEIILKAIYGGRCHISEEKVVKSVRCSARDVGIKWDHTLKPKQEHICSLLVRNGGLGSMIEKALNQTEKKVKQKKGGETTGWWE